MSTARAAFASCPVPAARTSDQRCSERGRGWGTLGPPTSARGKERREPDTEHHVRRRAGNDLTAAARWSGSSRLRGWVGAAATEGRCGSRAARAALTALTVASRTRGAARAHGRATVRQHHRRARIAHGADQVEQGRDAGLGARRRRATALRTESGLGDTSRDHRGVGLAGPRRRAIRIDRAGGGQGGGLAHRRGLTASGAA
jgi:hypothetical protein